MIKSFTTKALIVDYYLVDAFTTAAFIRLIEKSSSTDYQILKPVTALHGEDALRVKRTT